jgi:MarR family transcriptional regulator, 2-MHQ and catechol-resistance regulon repressor
MPTHHKGPPAEIAALDAYIKLMRATESVTTRVHETLPDGLTVTQFAVLESLFHLGPLCQGSLASKLLKSTANLTLVIANLEKAGLIKRVRQPDDLRFITVSLTSRGRNFIARLFPKVAASIATEFAVLTAREKIELGRLTKKLGLQPARSAQ